MSITVQFACGGCDNTAIGIAPLTRFFSSISDRPWGVGSYRYTTARDVVPEGWVAFDPHTGACYCPNCWVGIQQKEAG